MRPPSLVAAAAVAALVVAALANAAPARAQGAAEFYKGKQISFFIGYNPAGTYDVYARLAAAHLARHIPGHPTIVPKNMPGVASLKAASYLYSQAPRDGTAIGMVTQAVALEQLLKNPAVQYDVAKFDWLGRLTTAVEVTIVWHTVPVKTIQDAMTRETLLGATSAGGTSDGMPKLMNRFAGTKFKLVLGYQGTTGAMLAMERGEVEGTHSTAENLVIGKPDWLRDKTVSVLVQYSTNRHRAFPDVPTMVELGKTPEDRQILKLFGDTAEVGRAILLPPEVPPDRLAVLRKAFDAMAADKGFIAEMESRKMEFEPMSGEELQRRVKASLDIAPDLLEKAQKAREE
jgi:tripartite-type tricarboxylate transporter receptor subunit TctC